MRERIGPWLFPWLPLFVVAAVWVQGNSARMDVAEEQAYATALPSLVSTMLYEQAREANREEQDEHVLTSGLTTDQKELIDGE